MSQVWIVDDDQSIRWVLERALTRSGFDVRAFSSASECARALQGESPKVLVSDIRMPGENGIELLRKVKETHPKLPVIIMTAYSDLESAVSALQGGAFEYLPKPFDVPSAVDLIRRAVQEHDVAPHDAGGSEGKPEILGQAPAMQEVFRAIGRLAGSNVTVLITGESGSGKELVARALHDHSPRAGKAFVALNTAAIPKDLLESELFGHERGAFTGAQQTRVGRFEQAEGGTLFLDEIGDMPAELQTRLLRVLSDGHYYRVGGHRPQRANVRVIAATHQNLEERVRKGLFREDLYHRLNVIRLRLPPLRDRSEDIALLARHFLQKSARELGVEPKRLTEEALRALGQFDWPGNVRQLENVCHWLTVMAPTQTIDIKDLPPEVREQQARILEGARTQPAMALEHAGESTHAAVIESPAALATQTMPAPGRAQPASGVAAALVSKPYESASPDQGTGAPAQWASLLEREVSALLAAQSPEERVSGVSELMDKLAREFEGTVIKTALRHTRGRRIDAALRLGIGRNTITRKIQDLKLEED